MDETLFLTGLTLTLCCFLSWGFTHLPGERWQMLAVLPKAKGDGQLWHGMNLTYYGLFIAASQVFSISLLLVLLGAMKISLAGTVLATSAVLLVCLPAARLVAMVVERKRHTFTIGGASFVGIVLAPWAVLFTDELLSRHTACYLPLMPVLAAMAVAYTLGEGLGRLACLSYGCCYGKPLKDCSPLVRKMFGRTGTIFWGSTKKVQYESRLEGERLVPVQVITCMLYTLTSLAGCWLFLRGWFTAPFILSMLVTQIWRFFSEMLRADFRGFGKISAYQKMGFLAVLYSLAIAFFHHPQITATPAISPGLAVLWDPAVIIGLQLFGLICFIYFGRSTVTASTVAFSLVEERI